MIEALISMVKYLSPRSDDDAVDRLHYLYTPNILLAFAVLISFKQFGGKPIECMFPTKFPGSWEQYAENYCWSQDTYFVQDDEHVAMVPVEERYSSDRKLSYYKWVPFFLLFSAFCFRLPSIFWRYISLTSGLRIHEIVQRATDPANMEEETRIRNTHVITKQMQNALKFHRRIFTFLRTDRYDWFGYGVVRDILNDTEWQNSGYFPRVSLCDFYVRQVGNIQRYSVQCVLVINMFTEKIFVFLWFWYLILGFCTFLSLLYWTTVLTFPCFSRWFINGSLELSEFSFDPETRKKEVDRFVSKYLCHDGVFVLRVVSIHAGVIFSTELILSLFNSFYKIEEQLSEGRTSFDDRQDNKKNLLRRRSTDLSRQKRLNFEMDSILMPPADDDDERRERDDENVA